MANDNMKHRRLQELDESDFEIVDGQPDIRGWDVKGSSGDTIGEVDELILDAQARKVRYMVVDLDDDALDLDDDRKVLIPIGLAQLHEKDDDVLLPGVSLEQLKQLPEYDRDRLDPAAERSICSVLGRTGHFTDETVTDEAFYQHDHFNDQHLHQRRLLPERSTAAADSSGYQFRERVGDDSLRNEDERLRNRSQTYREVEEDSLQAVRRDRSESEIDRLDTDLESGRSESPVERDIERRNREGGSRREGEYEL